VSLIKAEFTETPRKRHRFFARPSSVCNDGLQWCRQLSTE
jgi:hypothetical protein